MDKAEIDKIQETLLDVLPYWNYRIAKPFKQLLDDGVSMQMYYCLRALQNSDEMMTMTELATWMQMTKQQMTKLANRLVELELVNRVFDPADRRIIKMQITEKARTYIDSFLNNDVGCFRKMFESLDETECAEFQQALNTVLKMLVKVSS